MRRAGQSGRALLEIMVASVCVSFGWVMAHLLASARPELMGEFAKYFYHFVWVFGVLMSLTEYLRRNLEGLECQDGVGGREYGRLRVVVRGKQRKLVAVLVFYLFSGCYMAAVSMFARGGTEVGVFVYDISGMIMGFTFFLFGDTWMEIREVADFRWEINERDRKKKAREEDLKTLAAKDDGR